jgi:hypothetical protein
MESSFSGLIRLLLPDYIIDHFELTAVEQKEETLHLYLEELNNPPSEYTNDRLQSKGFFDSITVQDFPIREHKVFLHIKRRRWINLTTNKLVFRDWELVAKGTRLTQGFASFLKEIGR